MTWRTHGRRSRTGFGQDLVARAQNGTVLHDDRCIIVFRMND
jgi:hypothetical protein